MATVFNLGMLVGGILDSDLGLQGTLRLSKRNWGDGGMHKSGSPPNKSALFVYSVVLNNIYQNTLVF